MTVTDEPAAPAPDLNALIAQLAAQLADVRRLAMGGGRAGAAPLLVPSTGLIPDPTDGALIESAWGVAIGGSKSRIVNRFDNMAQLTAQWPAAPDGAVVCLLDTVTLWIRRAGAWALYGPRVHSRATGQATLGAAYNPNIPTNVAVLWLSGTTDASGILTLDTTVAGLFPVAPVCIVAATGVLSENGDAVYGFCNMQKSTSTLTAIKFRFFQPTGTVWASRVVYYVATVYWQ